MALTVSLPDPLDDWVQSRVEAGAYGSADEYVQELIRRDQADSTQRDAVVAALLEGEASGESPRTILDIAAALRAEFLSRTG